MRTLVYFAVTGRNGCMARCSPASGGCRSWTARIDDHKPNKFVHEGPCQQAVTRRLHHRQGRLQHSASCNVENTKGVGQNPSRPSGATPNGSEEL